MVNLNKFCAKFAIFPILSVEFDDNETFDKTQLSKIDRNYNPSSFLSIFFRNWLFK